MLITGNKKAMSDAAMKNSGHCFVALEERSNAIECLELCASKDVPHKPKHYLTFYNAD